MADAIIRAKLGINHQHLFTFRRNHPGNRRFAERDKIKVSGVPARIRSSRDTSYSGSDSEAWYSPGASGAVPIDAQHKFVAASWFGLN